MTKHFFDVQLLLTYAAKCRDKPARNCDLKVTPFLLVA